MDFITTTHLKAKKDILNELLADIKDNDLLTAHQVKKYINKRLEIIEILADKFKVELD